MSENCGAQSSMMKMIQIVRTRTEKGILIMLYFSHGRAAFTEIFTGKCSKEIFSPPRQNVSLNDAKESENNPFS